MMYFQIDESGSPTSTPVNYEGLQIHLSKLGVAIPVEKLLTEELLQPLGFKKIDMEYAQGHTSDLDAVPPFHIVSLDLPTFENGQFKRTVKYVPATETQIKKVELAIRFFRAQILKLHVDWITPMSWDDFSQEEKEAISSFRRSLLDLTQHPSFPWISFPDPPACLLDENRVEFPVVMSEGETLTNKTNFSSFYNKKRPWSQV
jgi:hypothetical protein